MDKTLKTVLWVAAGGLGLYAVWLLIKQQQANQQLQLQTVKGQQQQNQVGNLVSTGFDALDRVFDLFGSHGGSGTGYNSGGSGGSDKITDADLDNYARDYLGYGLF